MPLHPVEFAVATVKLTQDYPYLQPVDPDKYDGLTQAAKNIRVELKRAFPGVKFSVRTDRFSGGDAIRVAWTDGPNTDQVDEIVSKYKAGSFDGSIDLYEYNDSLWTKIFGDAKYISTSREYSDSLIQSALDFVVRRYGNAGGEVKTVEDYRQGRIWRWQSPGGVDLDRELRAYLYKVSRSVN